jgi:hypothetical protein
LLMQQSTANNTTREGYWVSLCFPSYNYMNITADKKTFSNLYYTYCNCFISFWYSNYAHNCSSTLIFK